MKESELLIPNTIDKPKKMFLWDLDVSLICLIGFGVGVITRNFFLYPPFFFFAAWRWGKFKAGKHPWFFLHAILWYLPIPKNNACMPDSDKREFIK
ncbi:type IV conjugative transfer system protein TraL [Neisseria sp. Ec49-e6-T10]|uniref:type IV conjugative transfer system protein TraL n=1 Tax=Neisseria sp. Ec49-e6-T10 TaxID=3140744 RepID=UPI003EBECEAD